MRKLLVRALLLSACALPFTPGGLEAVAQEKTSPEQVAPKLSDAQIRKALIAESIQGYDGNCPCPYNRASNGSRCGKRSAWSRKGGEAPLCYASDIDDEMVAAERARLNAR